MSKSRALVPIVPDAGRSLARVTPLALIEAPLARLLQWDRMRDTPVDPRQAAAAYRRQSRVDPTGQILSRCV